jgi:hypothetical protein
MIIVACNSRIPVATGAQNKASIFQFIKENSLDNFTDNNYEMVLKTIKRKHLCQIV